MVPRVAPRCRRLAAAFPVIAALVLAFAAPAGAAVRSEPLARPRASGGPTLFTPLKAEDVGLVLRNDYADPAMWGRRFREFLLGGIGTGLAVADFDGDGRPDLFAVSKTESCRLFRNLGGWKFEDVTERAGVGDHGDAAAIWKQGATFADVNNDGLPDLYVCRFNAPNLLYINQGDGTFKEMAHAYHLDVVDACGMAAFCDYDRDGWLDVFIQTNVLDFDRSPHGQRNYLFHNNRDGTFTDVSAAAGITGIAQGHSATWWDYDNDGWPDLYVANDFAAPDVLYHNNGDGTFTNVLSRVVPHTPNSSMGADLGDVDNDGRIDFLAADMAARGPEKDQRGMIDGRSENPLVDADPVAAPQYPRNALYLNTGTGRCREAAFLAGIAATDWTWGPRFEDFDNDGRLDLFVTTGMVRELHNKDLIDRMGALQGVAERIKLVRDSPRLDEPNLAFRNLGGGRFESVEQSWGVGQSGVSFGSVAADFDGDGDLDLVVANYQAGLTVLRNDCPGGHRLLVDLRGVVSNRFGVGATVEIETASGRQVRPVVLARGYFSSSGTTVHFGLGAATRVERLTVAWPSGARQTLRDLAADRHYTIEEEAPPDVRPTPAAPVEARPAPGGEFTEVSDAMGLAVRSADDAGHEEATEKLIPFRHNRCGPAVAVGDFGDGRESVVIGGTTLDPIKLLVRGADGRFDVTAGPPARVNDGPVLVFDADGDGRNDLLLTSGGTGFPAGAPEYQPRLLLNRSGAGLAPAPASWLPSVPRCVGAAVAADFNRDGRLDVFLGARLEPGAYPVAPASALLANRGDHFEDVTDAIAPGLRHVGLVTGALWSDVDGDGWPDLVVCVEWGGVHYFHNDAGKGFTDWSERAGFATAGTGWWTSLASADFNGDGRPDFVIGNAGLNTKYRATPSEPALLFRGPLEPGGEPQVIEAQWSGGRLVPWRSRRELGGVLPALLRRYPGNNEFSTATLADLFGESWLTATPRWQATELRHGVLLSQPDGRYRFAPLPDEAQLAPLQGMVAADLDGDGRPDLYALQNSYAPVPSTGRWDGGISVLLRGDGRGGFAVVPAAESNLVVTGDARGLAALDWDNDGWPDLLVTRNNGTTLAFRNHGRTGGHAFAVRLDGGPGNPTGAGARISAVTRHGLRQTAEVFLGSSHFSQSSPAVFLGWPDGDEISAIEVRWPDGRVTRRVGPVASPVVRIARQ